MFRSMLLPMSTSATAHDRTDLCCRVPLTAGLLCLIPCSPLLFQVARGQSLNSTQITHIITQGAQTVDLVINNILVRNF